MSIRAFECIQRLPSLSRVQFFFETADQRWVIERKPSKWLLDYLAWNTFRRTNFGRQQTDDVLSVISSFVYNPDAMNHELADFTEFINHH